MAAVMVVEVVATAAVAMVAGRGGGGKGVEVTKAVKVVAVEMAAVTGPDISDWGPPGWRSIPTSNGTHIGSNQRARTHLRNPGCLDCTGCRCSQRTHKTCCHKRRVAHSVPRCWCSFRTGLDAGVMRRWEVEVEMVVVEGVEKVVANRTSGLRTTGSIPVGSRAMRDCLKMCRTL